MNIRKIVLASALATASLFAGTAAQASTVPFGVQNDVTAATVAGWGFTQCFSATYGTFGLTTAGMLSGCSGDILMMAARRTGSDVFEVLAAANFTDVTFDTGTGNVTHAANGAEWYFNNNYSWGFAGAGDAVSRNECDTNGQNERDRLCWHTLSGFSGGWRAGTFTDLNDDNGWEKVLLVGSAQDNRVPEPATLGLVGFALLGLAAARKRKSA